MYSILLVQMMKEVNMTLFASLMHIIVNDSLVHEFVVMFFHPNLTAFFNCLTSNILCFILNILFYLKI